ncbi:MAG: CHC2 zinc finger domain-containing protein [Roseiarcus sp.]|jgi:DNA primase
MSSYVDFQDLKARVNISDVLPLLGIATKAYGAQLRACCPIHKGSDPRGFVVTPAKGVWYCFGGCGGGDMIALVAKVRGCDPKDAARFIAEGTGTSSGNRTVPGNSTSSPQPKDERRRGFDPEAYAKGLDPAHAALASLGIAAETFRQWKAGYSTSGVNRGRLAFPIASKDGAIVGYAGRTVGEESPSLSFPNGLSPSEFIFGADRVTEGELHLVRDAIEVMRAYENGIENVVAFLTEVVMPQQLEMLSSLMDERKCGTICLLG